MPTSPTSQTNFPFQFRVSVENEDIRLITTSNIFAIRNLVEIFNLEDKIASEVKILFDSNMREKKHTIVSLYNRPEKGENFAYAALLECDLCGVRQGYFALFKSLSGNSETLAKECKEMHDFFNSEMDNNPNFQIVPRR